MKAAPATVATPRRLPRGVSSLPREQAQAEQRKRLVLATAQQVAARGYAQTAVADIIAAAGVSRATFYALFADKEACFLYGFEKLAAAHLRVVEAELARPGELPQRMQAALAAYLQRIDADRALACAFIAEAESATPRSREAMRLTQARLQALLSAWLAEVREQYAELAAEAGPAADADALNLVMTGLIGHVIAKVRRSEPFNSTDVRHVLRFIFAGLGLYGWAQHADRMP